MWQDGFLKGAGVFFFWHQGFVFPKRKMVLLKMRARAENPVFPDNRKLSQFRACAGSSQLFSLVQKSQSPPRGFEWTLGLGVILLLKISWRHCNPC